MLLWKKDKKEKVAEGEYEITKQKKVYTDNASVKILLTDVDDLDTGLIRPLKDVEAGSNIHGMIEVRLRALPINVTACAKFILKGWFLEHSRRKKKVEAETRKFLIDNTRCRLHPRQPLPTQQNNEGQFLIIYPFTFHVKEWLCGSIEVKSDKLSHNIFVKYEIHVKIKYLGSQVHAKSQPRSIGIVSHQPKFEELAISLLPNRTDNIVWLGGDPAAPPIILTNKFDIEIEKKKSSRIWNRSKLFASKDHIVNSPKAVGVQEGSDPGDDKDDDWPRWDRETGEELVEGEDEEKNTGYINNEDIDGVFMTMHPKYLEGTNIVFICDITNKTKTSVEAAEISLIQNNQYPAVPKDGNGVIKWCKWSIPVDTKKIRALCIGPESHHRMFFPMLLPSYIETPTTYFEFDSQRISVEYSAILKIQRARGLNCCKLKTSVYICANPDRFTKTSALATPPSFRPFANYPPKYQLLPKVPQVPRWNFRPPPILSIEIVRARGLPRMDTSLFGGKADPYVTIWVNDSFVQTTSIKTNTRNPIWNEKFHFPIIPVKESMYCPEDSPVISSFSDDATTAPVKVMFVCYDWDKSSADDEVGRVEVTVELGIRATQELELVLKRLKNKKEKQRGKVYIRFMASQKKMI